MLIVATVVILGWLMASLIGTWAYFAAESDTATR